ncbi:HAMP domain-containing histidine kinase [Metabacillus sp. GX 13764]|uniref:sensor histidine kinase n=1 Tax=Metabacillus kandeliae TaxID=2900151 RepID=UPI001E3F4D3E|nr:HAMP domain-containing sensor histidine kinase [Metabacillus kandeliae]MCD7036221.1 HAMP domain-containing histidine kinase [Metabacillus kandeliae]
MKNRPLFVQISLLFTGLIVFMAIVFFLVIPTALQTFFTNEMFKTIEEYQLTRTVGAVINKDSSQTQSEQEIRSVQDVLISQDGNDIRMDSTARLPLKVIQYVYKQAEEQRTSEQRYHTTIGNQELLYVIRPVIYKGNDYYQISYLWDTYRKELVKTLLAKILVIFILIIIGGIILSFIFSKMLIKPLEKINQHVKLIADRKLNASLLLKRGDEIGMLAESIEEMRIQLKKQDEFQQTMLQHVSHDLKTPIMVIRSYADALKEGVHPTGSPYGTAEIIEQEAEKLGQKIKGLLYLTKLDYLSQMEAVHEKVFLDGIIEDVIVRLKAANKNIKIKSAIQESEIEGDPEQLSVLFENLLDNALKYAKTEVVISSKIEAGKAIVQCFNDGEKIEEELLPSLFQPYIKGKKGNFGLGLAIIKRIADLHKAEVFAQNVEDGVSFTVIFPRT